MSPCHRLDANPNATIVPETPPTVTVPVTSSTDPTPNNDTLHVYTNNTTTIGDNGTLSLSNMTNDMEHPKPSSPCTTTRKGIKQKRYECFSCDQSWWSSVDPLIEGDCIDCRNIPFV